MRIPIDINLATWIRKLIKDNEVIKFYKTDDWKETRAEVLEDFHNECVHCMNKGKYTKAECVHHVNEVKKFPELALSKTFVNDEGKIELNLIPLCNECHNIEHDRFSGTRKNERFINEERW